MLQSISRIPSSSEEVSFFLFIYNFWLDESSFQYGRFNSVDLESPKKSHARRGLHLGVRGQPWVLVFTFRLVWSVISPCSLLNHWDSWPVNFQTFSCLCLPLLGGLVSQMCITVPGFTWVLGIWTQVVTLVWQVLYLQKSLSSLRYFIFSDLYFISSSVLLTYYIYMIVCDYFPAARL